MCFVITIEQLILIFAGLELWLDSRSYTWL